MSAKFIGVIIVVSATSFICGFLCYGCFCRPQKGNKTIVVTF